MPDEHLAVATDARLARLRRFATWLDAGVTLPIVRWRFGLDPVLGLVPGLGDAAGAALAIWILVEGFRRGASRATLVRIALYIGVDALIGSVPVLGDAFDFAWKANLKSVALLERHHADPVTARRSDRLFLGVLTGSLLLICGALVVGTALLTVGLIRRLGGL